MGRIIVPGLIVRCLSCDGELAFHEPLNTVEVREAKSCCERCMKHLNR